MDTVTLNAINDRLLQIINEALDCTALLATGGDRRTWIFALRDRAKRDWRGELGALLDDIRRPTENRDGHAAVVNAAKDLQRWLTRLVSFVPRATREESIVVTALSAAVRVEAFTAAIEGAHARLTDAAGKAWPTFIESVLTGFTRCRLSPLERLVMSALVAVTAGESLTYDQIEAAIPPGDHDKSSTANAARRLRDRGYVDIESPRGRGIKARCSITSEGRVALELG